MTIINNLDLTYMLPSGLWCASRARAICRPRSRTCSKLPCLFFCFSEYPRNNSHRLKCFRHCPAVVVARSTRRSACQHAGENRGDKKRQKTVDSRPTSADFVVRAPLYFPHRVSHEQICPFPTKILVQKIPRARANAKVAAFSSAVRARRL